MPVLALRWRSSSFWTSAKCMASPRSWECSPTSTTSARTSSCRRPRRGSNIDSGRKFTRWEFALMRFKLTFILMCRKKCPFLEKCSWCNLTFLNCKCYFIVKHNFPKCGIDKVSMLSMFHLYWLIIKARQNFCERIFNYKRIKDFNHNIYKIRQDTVCSITAALLQVHMMKILHPMQMWCWFY